MYSEDSSGVVYLQFPTGANTPALTGYDFMSEPKLVSNDALSALVQTIRALENEPESVLEKRRQKGMNFSRASYGIDAVRRQLKDILM